ncbi:hypothetical protein HYT84_01275 [Candidatus Micrarchaeota archaeon]|nr:hypothetical protein [Candidatus Micrarchaeota archaeon]
MLSSTGEIGYYKIVKRESIQDGIERITYKAGSVAVKYMQEKEAVLRNAGAVFSVTDSEIIKTSERFFNEWKEQKKLVDNLLDELAKDRAEHVINESTRTKKTVVKILDYDKTLITKIGALVSQNEHASAVLLNKQMDVVCAAGKGSGVTAKELISRVIGKLGGNGGGNERFATGKVSKVSDSI